MGTRRELKQLLKKGAKAVNLVYHNSRVFDRRLVGLDPRLEELSRASDARQRIFNFVRESGSHHAKGGQSIIPLLLLFQFFLVAQIV